MHKVVVTAKISPEGPHNAIFAHGGFSVAFPPAGCDPFQEQALIGLLKDVDAVVAKIKEMKPFQGDDWFDSTGYGETVIVGRRYE